MTEFKYRPDVDGLRAVAVGMVLLYHANLGFPGGFVGVDVFFVISGFLITGLILKEQNAGEFSLANFWVRRIRRIIPASTVVVFATLLAGFFLLLPDDYTSLSKSAVAQQLMLSNVFFWRSTGYFDGPAELMPLLHTWSLAVEEQFYLGFPVLLIFLNRCRRRNAGLLLFFLFLISLAASHYGVKTSPSATFFLLPARAWELLAGGLLWFLPAPKHLRPWMQGVLAGVSIAGIITAGWIFSADTPFPGLNATLPCGATALLIYVNSCRISFPASIIASKPFVFIGLLSYSLYLWHWPILAFTRYWIGIEFHPLYGVGAISLSSLLAYLSWRFIETPLRRSKIAVPRVRVYSAAILSASIVIAISSIIVWRDGLPSRLPQHVRGLLETGEIARVPVRTPKEIASQGLPLLAKSADISKGGIDLVMWGDSHTEMIFEVATDLSEKHSVSVAIAVKHGTLPLVGIRPQFNPDKKEAWNAAVLRFIKENSVKNVLLTARWENASDWKSLDDKRRLSFTEMKTTREAEITLAAGLEKTIKELSAQGVRIWIMRQVPVQEGVNPRNRIVLARIYGLKLPNGTSLKRHTKRHEFVSRVFARDFMNEVVALDPTRFCFDSNGRSIICDDVGNCMYRDDDHLSPLGAKLLLSDLLETVFTEIEMDKSQIQ